MRRFSIVLWLAFAALDAHAAFERRTFEARSAALAGAGAADVAGAAAMELNPAGLASENRFELRAGYSRPFLLPGLNASAAQAAARTRWGTLGLGVSQWSAPGYREQEWTAAHALRPLPGLRVGAAFKMLRLGIDDYGSASAWSVDAGAQFDLGRGIRAAAAGRNLNHARIGRAAVEVPSAFTLALRARLPAHVAVHVDVERAERSPLSLQTGVEWELGPLRLRGGARNPIAGFAAGLGWQGERFGFDYAYAQAGQLPASHSTSVRWMWPDAGGSEGAAWNAVEPPLDLAVATAEELERLPAIGKVTARAIVAFRERNGLSSIDDLIHVPGMRKKAFAVLQRECRLSAAVMPLQVEPPSAPTPP